MKNVEGVDETAGFIRKVLDFWTIMNVKRMGSDERHRNPLERVIDDTNDYRLQILLNFGDMARKMSASSQGKRVKQLMKDTAIHHTY